jgi:hypothetical protein
MKEH